MTKWKFVPIYEKGWQVCKQLLCLDVFMIDDRILEENPEIAQSNSEVYKKIDL